MLGTRRLAALLALGAAFAVPIAGCGGSSNNNSTTNASTSSSAAGTGATAAAAGAGGTVHLAATEYKFTPSDATVKSGNVTFDETNDGHITHSLEIEDVTPGHDQEMEGTVAPGQSGTLTANLKPGKYEFYCPISNHKMLGMTGEITVK
jgi:uncharacterized cupredoxin-like copper-binding protein